MFQRRPNPATPQMRQPSLRAPVAVRQPGTTEAMVAPAPTAVQGPRNLREAARRLEMTTQQMSQRGMADRAGSAVTADMRRLIVGPSITLAGEISACDALVVEGTVEARLRDGQLIEVAQSGVFRGSVEIEDADIAGTFEGELSVRHKLRVRSTGRVTGTIRYGEIEVQAGGQLVGQIQVMSRTAAQAYKEAARQAMDEGVDGAPGVLEGEVITPDYDEAVGQ